MKNTKKVAKRKSSFLAAQREIKRQNNILKKVKIKKVHNVIHKSIVYYNIKEGRCITMGDDYRLIERLTLNYVRHKLSNYDRIIQDTNISNNMYGFKDLVNQKILSTYAFQFEEYLSDRARILR